MKTFKSRLIWTREESSSFLPLTISQFFLLPTARVVYNCNIKKIDQRYPWSAKRSSVILYPTRGAAGSAGFVDLHASFRARNSLLDFLKNRYDSRLELQPGTQLEMCAGHRITVNRDMMMSDLVSVNCRVPAPLRASDGLPWELFSSLSWFDVLKLTSP